MTDNNKHLNDDKLEGNEISFSDGITPPKKVGNLWYHHKWTIIIVAFFLVVLIVVGVQLLTRVKYDVNVTISGPDFLKSDGIYYVSNDLSNLLSDDINRDGKRAVTVTTYPVFSESELKSINTSERDSSGNFIKIVEESENLSQYKQFMQQVQSGDSYIFILSKYTYEPLKATNPSRLAPISDIFGTDLPEGTLDDGYGIKISSTALYESSATIQSLGDDYILCICKLPDMASKRMQKNYSATVEYFKDLVG